MIRRFPGGVHTIVTAEAVPTDSRMIELRVEPTTRGMTVLAGIAALNVIRRFPGGVHTIVTAEAVPTDSRMIEARVRP